MQQSGSTAVLCVVKCRSTVLAEPFVVNEDMWCHTPQPVKAKTKVKSADANVLADAHLGLKSSCA